MYSRYLIIILLIFSVAIVSCSGSGDDDGQSDDDFFLTVNIKGSSYTDTEFDFPGLPRLVYYLDCDTDEELMRHESVGGIRTSENFVAATFLHYYDSDHFSDNVSQPTNLIKSRPLTPDCFDNFDFMVRVGYHPKDGYFNLDTTSSNVNRITRIERLTSDSEGTVYAITGNFSATFIDYEDIPIPITGNYRFRVYVLD